MAPLGRSTVWCSKSCTLGRGPVEISVPFKQVPQRLRHSRQIWDERGHVSCYTKKGLKFFGILWLLNCLNVFQLFSVKMYPFRIKSLSKKCDRCLLKHAFVQDENKSMFLWNRHLVVWVRIICLPSLGPCTAMSSAIPTVPGNFSRIKFIFCWNLSWLTHSPKETRVKLNLPNELFKVVRASTISHKRTWDILYKRLKVYSISLLLGRQKFPNTTPPLPLSNVVPE